MEHILTTKGTMPKPEALTGASIPEYIEIKTATGDTVAFLSPESDGVKECWIDDEQNGICTIEIELFLTSEKWQYLTDQYRIYAGDKEFVIHNPDAIDRQREGKKLTGKIKAHESWVLLGKKFQTISNDPQNQSPPWGAAIILSGGAPKGGFAQGSAGSALSWLLEGTGWTVGTVDVVGTYDLETEKESVLANINAIQQKWGGILVWDSINHTVSLRDEETWQNYTGYQIRYAKNLKGISRADDYDIVTRLYPFGENDLNISAVNGGLLYLDNQSYSTEVLEGVWYNQDITDQTQLKTQGEKQLAVMCKPRHNYKTEVLDLRSLPGYGHETFARSDMVDLFDEEFGANARVRIIRYRHNVFQPWLCDMELGDPIEKIQATVAQTVLMAKFYKNVVAPNTSFQNLLKAIINTEATEINGANGDYTLVDGVSTWTDPDTGDLVRITPKGLIISEDGGQTWKTAISGKGIHADAGWVGKLNAGVITVGANTSFDPGYDPSKVTGMGVDNDCTALFHFDGSLVAHNGLTPTFTRNSGAFESDGTSVPAGKARFEGGKFGKGVLVEEGTTNLINPPKAATFGGAGASLSIAWTSASNFKISGTSAPYGTLAFTVHPTNLATKDISQVTISFKNPVKMELIVVQLIAANGTAIESGWNSDGWTYNVYYKGWYKGLYNNETQITLTGLPAGVRGIGFGAREIGNDGGVFSSCERLQIEAKPFATSFINGSRAAEALIIPRTSVLPSLNTFTIAFRAYPNLTKIGLANIPGTNFARTGFVEIGEYHQANQCNITLWRSENWDVNSIGLTVRSNQVTTTETSHITLTQAEWEEGPMIVLRYDEATFYLDTFTSEGHEQVSVEASITHPVADLIRIGRAGAQYINGLLDELRIDKVCRTDDEIAAWYKAQSPFYSSEEIQTVAGNKSTTFTSVPTNGKYKQDDVLIPAAGFSSGGIIFNAGEVYTALTDGNGVSFVAAHWTEATLLSAWKKTGTTLIDGGQLSADSVTADKLVSNTAMINFINALNITAKYISANGITAGNLTLTDLLKIVSSNGNLEISGSQLKFAHSNGTESRLNAAGLQLYDNGEYIPYVSTVLADFVSRTAAGWDYTTRQGGGKCLYSIALNGNRWIGKASSVKVIVSPTQHIYPLGGPTNASRVTNYFCEVDSVTDTSTGVLIKILSMDEGYEVSGVSGYWYSWSLSFNYMIVLT